LTGGLQKENSRLEKELEQERVLIKTSNETVLDLKSKNRELQKE
jgi:hypothetical protein